MKADADTVCEKAGSGRCRRRILAAALLIALIPAGYVGYVFGVRGNFRTVVPGEVYTSAQLRTDQLRRILKDYDIHTVLNLRGNTGEAVDRGSLQDLQSTAELQSLALSARTEPDALELLGLIDAIESADRPLLIHCHHGMDRSGLAAAVAAMAVGGVSYDEARRLSDVPRLPWKHGLPHISDVLDRYEAWCATEGLSTAGWTQFRRWAEDVFAADVYWARVEVPDHVRMVVGQPGRVTVRVVNTSRNPIPASRPNRGVRVVAYWGPSVYRLEKSPLAGPAVSLPSTDIVPGQVVEVVVALDPLPSPTERTIYFDLVDNALLTLRRPRADAPSGTVIVSQAEVSADTRE